MKEEPDPACFLLPFANPHPPEGQSELFVRKLPSCSGTVTTSSQLLTTLFALCRMAHLNVHRFGSAQLARRAANLNPSVKVSARGVPVVNGLNLNAKDPHHGDDAHGHGHGPAMRKDFNLPKWAARVEMGGTGVARLVSPMNGELLWATCQLRRCACKRFGRASCQRAKRTGILGIGERKLLQIGQIYISGDATTSLYAFSSRSLGTFRVGTRTRPGQPQTTQSHRLAGTKSQAYT